MKVIIEGPDGTGKSTLVDFLKKNYFKNKVSIFKLNDKSDIKLENYIEILNNKDQNLICDRFNLSEDVYSTIYQRIPKNSFLDHLKVFSLVEDKNIIYIILYSSSFRLLEERCHQRGDTEQVYNNLFELNQYYYNLGKELKKLYPTNIKLLDIAEIPDIFKYVENILKGVNNEQDKSNSN